jgi:sulfonate transport system ATP-binding protein
MSTAVRIRNLERRFEHRKVLSELNLTIRKGEFVALLGRSGSGKSTLLRALASLDHDSEGSGEIVVPAKRSVIFQDARLLPWRRVLDNVTLGLNGADAHERAVRALEEVELAGREQSWPYELSGGEQQRVALARSLVREPELLLADEPFSALDALTRIRMHVLLRRLSKLHRPAVLLVTHDVDEAIELADRVVVLDSGKLVADLAIERSNDRERRENRNGALRTKLLRWLGVNELPDMSDEPLPVPEARFRDASVTTDLA